jgi:microtubule-associated protein-like 5
MPNANIKWDSMHCTLGYCLLGIWAPYSNGSDINAVDVSTQLGVCVTAEDTGAMHLLSYPCVVKHAPRKTYDAHSSHVTNVRIFQLDDGKAYVASVGGRDATVALWKLNSVPKVAPLKDYTNVL